MNPLSVNEKLEMSLDEIQEHKRKMEFTNLRDLSQTASIMKFEDENDKLKSTISRLLKKNETLEFDNTLLSKKFNNVQRNFKSLLKEKQNATTELWKLQKEYKHLSHKYNENVEITILYKWIIHIDSNSQEYVSGYRYHSDSIWDTTFIKEKIAMSTYLLIITENENMYCLPYVESDK